MPSDFERRAQLLLICLSRENFCLKSLVIIVQWALPHPSLIHIQEKTSCAAASADKQSKSSESVYKTKKKGEGTNQRASNFNDRKATRKALVFLPPLQTLQSFLWRRNKSVLIEDGGGGGDGGCRIKTPLIN